ncbi:MAG: APC family permease [Victivallales bacterium]|nr:APC family permease [Victivallales bacterium]
MQSPQSKLGILSCTALLVGGLIGSAIFSLSGLTMFLAGPAAILSWVIGGLIMMAYGLFMGELACVFPYSGGVYMFPRLVYGGERGRLLGWLACWGSILTNISAIAFGAIYVGIYLSLVFPWAGNLQVPLALLSILACLALNLVQFSTTGKVNAVIVVVLLATMGIYIAAAFGTHSYNAQLLRPFFTQGVGGKLGFLSSVPIAMVGYSAIVAIAFMVSEVRNPRRTVPLSMLCAVGIVMLAYVLMIVGTLGLVSAAELAEKPDIRFIPIFAAASKLQKLPWLPAVVSISSVLALLTTILICISMNARAIQASSQDGILPAFLAKSLRNGEPAAAAAMTCILAALCACFPQFTSQIINLGTLFNVITIIITISALIQARRHGMIPTDAFHAPGGVHLPYIILAILLLCNLSGLLAGGITIWLFTAILMAIGLPFFYFQRT